MKEYYDLRAPDYNDWWIGAARERPGWQEELDAALATIAALPPARTLDHSPRMLVEAHRRLPSGTFVQGDALHLPFADGAFGRIFTSYFYCHLVEHERRRFVAEARRVADELVVMGSRHDGDEPAERWEQRPLKDGTTWPVFKRVFDPDALAAELEGDVIHAGGWFVVVRSV